MLISYLGAYSYEKRFMDGTVGGILADDPVQKAFLALMGIRCVLVAQVITNFGERQRGEQSREKNFNSFRGRHRLRGTGYVTGMTVTVDVAMPGDRCATGAGRR